MKLATFENLSGRRKIGVVLEGGVLDLADAHVRIRKGTAVHLTEMLALIDAGEHGLDQVRFLVDQMPEESLFPFDRIKLLAPLPLPRQIRDFLLFEEHLKNCLIQNEKMTGVHQEIAPVWYEQPIYYKANRFSVCGPGAYIQWPHYAELLDYELELACVIGRPGVDITREAAQTHIFGYTIFNDVSARDAQMKEMPGRLGPAKGKDFDTGNVFGPWIVTPDEIGNVYDLVMTARVNGEEWSRGYSGAMHHKFEDVIAFVSRSETLYGGEILCSGTVGTGCGLEQGRFLKPDDVIELEIDRIGVLANRIVR